MTSGEEEGHFRGGASYYIMIKDYKDKHIVAG